MSSSNIDNNLEIKSVLTDNVQQFTYAFDLSEKYIKKYNIKIDINILQYLLLSLLQFFTYEELLNLNIDNPYKDMERIDKKYGIDTLNAYCLRSIFYTLLRIIDKS